MTRCKNKIHEELYDLKKDPMEKRNIIKNEFHIANSLREQLLKIRKEVSTDEPEVGSRMSEEEEKIVIERLKNLGYIE